MKASVTDADARIMRQGDGGFAPSYNAQISTDSTHGVVVAYEISQAKEDSQELPPALERIEQNTGRQPAQILVDGGYTTRQNILETAEGRQRIDRFAGARTARATGSGTACSRSSSRSTSSMTPERDGFTCPAGKFLPYLKSKKLVGATEKQYQAKASDCRECPFRAQCCPQAKSGRDGDSNRRGCEGRGLSAEDATAGVPSDLSATGAGGGVLPRLLEREARTAAVFAPGRGSPSGRGLA